MAVAKQEEVTFEVVEYMKTPLERAALEALVDMLEGPVEDLVRKDGAFKALGLDASALIGNKQAVVALLEEHHELMQRPVLVRGARAIIGRPKERVADFLR